MNFKNLRWLWLSLIVFILDQSSKWFISHSFVPSAKTVVFPFLNLHFWFNRGAAFSFLNTAGGWQRWFFVGVAIIVCAAILIWLYRLPREEKLMGFALGLVFGGAAGNLWDRLILGHVIDFIEAHVGQWYFPIFNVADAAISVGAALILFDFIKAKRGD